MSGTILANVRPGMGMATLIAGRILYGAGVGFTMHGAPTYMAEMSPSTVRGTMVSAKATVSVFGIVVGMLMGDLMSDYPDNWTGKYYYYYDYLPTNYPRRSTLPFLYVYSQRKDSYHHIFYSILQICTAWKFSLPCPCSF
jgi:MFS family permease